MRALKRPLLICLFLLILLSLYWYGAMQQFSQVNTSPSFTDQGSYMNYTRRLVETDYSYPGDGIRMPLYPLMQSLFYDVEENREVSFNRGKYVNLGLSIVILIGIFLIIRPHLKWHSTLNFMLIVSFTVFMFKAPYYQAELLFYFFSFVFFMLMLRLFRKPSYLVAILTGVLVGLAYLTKASVTPGLLLFLFFIGLKGLVQIYQRRQLEPDRKPPVANWPMLLIVPLVASFFLITVYAQIRNTKKLFDRYFFNATSTFYMWFDTWEEAKQWMSVQSMQEGYVNWPDTPPEELPSLQKYLREHTATQILVRIFTGTVSVVVKMIYSFGYHKYLLIYSLMLLLVSTQLWSETKQRFSEEPFLLMFVLSYFLVYFMLYGWYTPIASGTRFTLSLFLPLLFVLLRGLQSFNVPRSQIAHLRRLDFLAIVNVITLAILIVDIFMVLTQRISTVYGGA